MKPALPGPVLGKDAARFARTAGTHAVNREAAGIDGHGSAAARILGRGEGRTHDLAAFGQFHATRLDVDEAGPARTMRIGADDAVLSARPEAGDAHGIGDGQADEAAVACPRPRILGRIADVPAVQDMHLPRLDADEAGIAGAQAARLYGAPPAVGVLSGHRQPSLHLRINAAAHAGAGHGADGGGRDAAAIGKGQVLGRDGNEAGIAGGQALRNQGTRKTHGIGAGDVDIPRQQVHHAAIAGARGQAADLRPVEQSDLVRLHIHVAGIAPVLGEGVHLAAVAPAVCAIGQEGLVRVQIDAAAHRRAAATEDAAAAGQADIPRTEADIAARTGQIRDGLHQRIVHHVEVAAEGVHVNGAGGLARKIVRTDAGTLQDDLPADDADRPGRHPAGRQRLHRAIDEMKRVRCVYIHLPAVGGQHRPVEQDVARRQAEGGIGADGQVRAAHLERHAWAEKAECRRIGRGQRAGGRVDAGRKNAAVGEGKMAGGAETRRTADIQRGVGAEDDAGRIEEIQIRAGNRRGDASVDVGTAAAGDPADDVRHRGRAGEGRRFGRSQVERREGMEQVAAHLPAEVCPDGVIRPGQRPGRSQRTVHHNAAPRRHGAGEKHGQRHAARRPAETDFSRPHVIPPQKCFCSTRRKWTPRSWASSPACIARRRRPAQYSCA